MEKHIKKTHGAKDTQIIHECAECNKKYFNENEFKKHMERHNKKTEKEVKSALRKSMEEKNTEIIRQYCSMICSLCPIEFTSFTHVKVHYRTVHKLSGFVECCKKKYTKLCRILEHCSRHFNPERIP